MSTVATRSLADIANDELVAIALNGLTPSTARRYRSHFNSYRAHREAESVGAALRELIVSSRHKAARFLEEYRGALRDRGLAVSSIDAYVIALIGAVRQCRLAGLTILALDFERRRNAAAPKVDSDGPLLSIATAGLGKAYARFGVLVLQPWPWTSIDHLWPLKAQGMAFESRIGYGFSQRRRQWLKLGTGRQGTSL